MLSMEWITVASFLLIGIVLIIVEIIFIPGTTVVGIIGFLIALVGVYLSFLYFGTATGWIITGGTAAVTGSMLFLSLRMGVWSRFALKDTNTGRVNDSADAGLKVGMEGLTVSSLRPMGKAEFGGRQFEVTTLGNLIPAGTRVKVVTIAGTHITVEPIS